MKKAQGLTVLELFLVLAAIAVLGWILAPNFYRHRDLPGNQYRGCKSNLKTIATVLEMYAVDHRGRYPSRLDQLLEGPAPYLKLIPTCPSAGRSTYLNYQVTYQPDNYTFGCVGTHHQAFFQALNATGDTQDYPRYSSTQGLLEPSPPYRR